MQTAVSTEAPIPTPPLDRELKTLPLDVLHISETNVRFGKKAPDVSDILPSVKSIGVLQPLLVRKEDSGFGIVAGRRRYFAAIAASEATGTSGRVPTILLGDDEDATAVEASLLENVARQNMDQVAEFEAFNRLHKQGKSIDEIAATFSVKPINVRQRLAIATLHPRIRKAYQSDAIGPDTMQALAMASKRQQLDWLALFKNNRAPRGWQLKKWLFGGEINPKVALFDVEASKCSVVNDLFGETEYFADAALFWELQNAAVEEQRKALLDSGWTGVTVIDQQGYFQYWDYVKTKKADGGKVFIEVKSDGSVKFHKGYLSKSEAKKAQSSKGKGKAAADQQDAPRRSEITAAMQNYAEYHRHAAVRAELITQHGLALRLTVAAMIAGTSLTRAEPDPARYANEVVADSVTASTANATFVKARDAAKKLIGDNVGEGLVHDCRWDGLDAAELFVKLLPLTDKQVLSVIAVIAAETLPAGDELVELLGNHLQVDMTAHWKPEPAILELIRDKSVLDAVLTEVAGKTVAKDHVKTTGKAKKAAIQTALDAGAKWLPRYLAFPFRSYVNDHGIGIAGAWKNVRKLVSKK